jgi:hypothetical protein
MATLESMRNKHNTERAKVATKLGKGVYFLSNAQPLFDVKVGDQTHRSQLGTGEC